MATRNGKIANLPNDIREKLNLRLLEGESGGELAGWLNALPEVQSVLGLQFNGVPISEVNLTHWRQGGYLQWFTEWECFDSARALAEGDCNLAKAGLTTERLLNILTLRFGQLLMYWDLSPDESVSETAAFSETARKARILQAISRSVLAMHRIQSQSACSKTERARSSLDSRARSDGAGAPTPESGFSSHPFTGEGSRSETAGANGKPFLPQPRDQGPKSVKGVRAVGMETAEGSKGALAAGMEAPKPETGLVAAPLGLFRAPRVRAGARAEILSGPISLSSIFRDLSQTQFKADADLTEVLKAV